MKTDLLLEQFTEFQISDSEKRKIYGGYTVNGCTLSGTNSYVDYISSVDGSQVCDYLVSSTDSSNWITSICNQL